jgi:hypothetical protein
MTYIADFSAISDQSETIAEARRSSRPPLNPT